MGSKFQLNEGEVQRILNLHRTAILKENKSIISEADTFKTVSPLELDPSQGYDNYDGIKIWGAEFKPSTKIKNSLVTTKQITIQGLKSNGTVYEGELKNNKGYVVYNCKTKRGYVIGSTNKKAGKYLDYNQAPDKPTYDMKNFKSLDKLCLQATVRDEVVVTPDKCAIRKPQVDGKVTTQDISYYYDGKSKCERGQGSKGFSSIEDCTKKCVTQKKYEEDAKDKYRTIIPVIDDEDVYDDEIVRGGESDDDYDKKGCKNRHKTLECRSSQKNCNTESIRAQALINCKCPSNVLDALLRGFPRARTGNPGDYTLREDGIWGSGSKAAWETCEDLIRRGSSRNDGKDDDDDKNKDKNTTDDPKVKDEKDLNNNLPKQKDLKLSPEEFAKLIQ